MKPRSDAACDLTRRNMEKTTGKNTNWHELTTVLSPETWDETALQEILQKHRTTKSAEYDLLLRIFQDRADRQSVTGALKKGDPLLSILSKLQALSSSLTEEHAPLVNLILRCEWCDGNVEGFNLFLKFVASLLTAQPVFVDNCLRNLVRRFRTLPPEPSELCEPSERVERVERKLDLNLNSFKTLDEKIKVYFDRIHAVLSRAVHIVPLSVPKLLKLTAEGFPYKLRPEEEHFLYTYNILLLHRRHPFSRTAIFSLLIEHIVKIDAEASPQELNDIDLDEDDSEEEEEDEDNVEKNNVEKAPPSWKIEHPTAERLDLILTLLFEYIEQLSTEHTEHTKLNEHTERNEHTEHTERNEHGERNDRNGRNGRSERVERSERGERGERGELRQSLCDFYEESLAAFENVVFKGHGLTHVQFLWFFMASLEEKISEDFLRRLMRKIVGVTVPPVFRQYAVCYVSSFLARAKFVSVRVVIKFLDEMVQWIHDYITEYDTTQTVVEREKIHRVFYAVCQNVFYLLTFRHCEIFTQRKGLLWFKTLNIERIIMARLNPFKYSQKIVVELFAAVTRQYNLLFCYTVIERNNRLAIFSGSKDDSDQLRDSNPLNTFFPFEPFVLKRSKRFVVPNYRTYDEPVTVDSPSESGMAYRGLIADSEESEESRDSDIVNEEQFKNTSFPRTSRKRQLSENN